MASSSLPSLHLHSPFLLSPSHASFLISRTRWTRRPLGFPRGRGTTLAATIGPEDFSDLHAAPELLGRVEGWLYTLADAALTATTSPDVGGTLVEEGQNQGRDWLSGITDSMEAVLKVLNDGLSTMHVPYSYGFAIILLTILVKAATFPLTKKQVESTLAMKSLQPQVKAVQQRYAGDQERIQLETARLYKLAGVNPLAGCLPILATIPVWIGLYRALSNVANEGLLTERFFWIPSLSGPTTIGARQSGSGISWLFPFMDGHPPLGWPNTLAYLVLPVLLVVSQYISVQIMQPPTQGNDPNQKNAQVITRFLPLMIGYFSLSVPSGLSLYWFTNNVLSTAQQIWLQKLGGAKSPVKEITSSIQTEIKAPHSSNETEITALPSSNQTDSMVNIKKEISTEAKSGSGVAVPGERFRQIKAQEARRRQEKEDRRKVEEAAKESYSEDDCSKVSPEKVNGSHANQEERNEVLYPGTNNGGIAQNSNLGIDDSPENAQKKETLGACTSIKKQTEQISENDSTMQQQAASKQKSSILKI